MRVCTCWCRQCPAGGGALSWPVLAVMEWQSAFAWAARDAFIHPPPVVPNLEASRRHAPAEGEAAYVVSEGRKTLGAYENFAFHHGPITVQESGGRVGRQRIQVAFEVHCEVSTVCDHLGCYVIC